MPNNPNCALTWAGIRFLGREFDARMVTDLLAIQPTEAFSYGDPYRGGVRHRSFWGLSSRDQLESTDLQEHLIWLLDRLEPAREEIQKLRAQGNMRADFYCVWMSATGEGGPIFSSGVLSRVALFGINLGISFTDLSDGSEQSEAVT
jgi:hypothetical protein